MDTAHDNLALTDAACDDGGAGRPDSAPRPKRPKKVRLDELLVARGDFVDAGEVLRAVMAREVRVDDVYVSSAAIKVRPDADVFLRGRRAYVSRGGHKLRGALDAFAQDVTGLRCLDIGSSTGGFTDCLLQGGAAEVAAVDVNYGQLAWKLRQDGRVRVFERTNIREADPAALGAPFDIVVIDVSFIGLAPLAPVIAALCAPGSVLMALVKPQFESRHDETDHGIVRDEAVRLRTVDEVRAALGEEGFDVTGVIESPIRGADGNVEYLVRAVYQGRG
ncbi:MAG: TlyA family RNA methyltransferase [Eggerthellaceae bacterium]|nr:TlyA family RNA methyltransferase [Eggerthellaceae bacterium]